MDKEPIKDPQYPMLHRLVGIMVIHRDDDGFYLGDDVDRYTGESFTREELIQLSDELRAIAAAPSPLPAT
jgi:hypothetical protein